VKGAAEYMRQLGLNGSAWEEQQIDGFSLMQFAEIVTPPFRAILSAAHRDKSR